MISTLSDEGLRRELTRCNAGARTGEVTKVADAAELLGDSIVR